MTATTKRRTGSRGASTLPIFTIGMPPAAKSSCRSAVAKRRLGPMRSDLRQTLDELTALRKRAGEIIVRIRREADLLADVHHELADLLTAIGPLSLAPTRQSSSSSSSPSRSASTTAGASSPSANVDFGPRLALLRIDAVALRLGLSRSQVWRMGRKGRAVPKAAATIDACRRLARTRSQRLDRRPTRVRRTAATCAPAATVAPAAPARTPATIDQ
jgi:hypothetical protein